MTIEAMIAVAEHSQTTGATRLCMFALANYANHDGEAWPAVGTIARFANIDHRTAQRALGEAEDMGEVARLIGAGRVTATGATNRYRLNLPGVQPVDNRDCRGGISPPVGVASHPQGVASRPLRGGEMPPEPNRTQLTQRRKTDPSVIANGVFSPALAPGQPPPPVPPEELAARMAEVRSGLTAPKRKAAEDER